MQLTLREHPQALETTLLTRERLIQMLHPNSIPHNTQHDPTPRDTIRAMTTQTADPTEQSAAKDTPEPAPRDLSPDTLAALEAVLLSADRATKPQTIIDALKLLPYEDDALQTLDEHTLTRAIAALNDHYSSTNRAFTIERVAAGYRVMTRPEFAPVIAALQRAKAPSRLTRTQLETLAIIAYRQPITRAELEAIRGVACGDVVRALMDRQLVKITGRAEELGRPMLYGTTPRFLDLFGLASLKDLPKPEDLLAQATTSD